MIKVCVRQSGRVPADDEVEAVLLTSVVFFFMHEFVTNHNKYLAVYIALITSLVIAPKFIQYLLIEVTPVV